MRCLGGMSAGRFAAEHWQRRPLMVRDAFPGFSPPLDRHELATLACDEACESRLVVGNARSAEHLAVEEGPFDPSRLERLPETGWALLVHGVDLHLPSVAALIESFRFLPNWRFDDVMVSFSAPGGGVGPHVDEYDVFLIQGEGRREWSVGSASLTEPRLVPEHDLELLESFEASASWTLEPGDLLYVPPRVPHAGVAVEPSSTFSVGFGAPSERDAIAAALSRALEPLDDGAAVRRFGDAGLDTSRHPGEIGPAARLWMREAVERIAADDELLDRALGELVTDGACPEVDPDSPLPTGEEIASLVRGGGRLVRRAPHRLAHIERDGGRAILFVAGESFDVGHALPGLAPLLCGSEPLDRTTLEPHLASREAAELLARLVESGVLGVDSPEST